MEYDYKNQKPKHILHVKDPAFPCITRRNLAFEDFEDETETQGWTSLNIPIKTGDIICIFHPPSDSELPPSTVGSILSSARKKSIQFFSTSELYTAPELRQTTGGKTNTQSPIDFYFKAFNDIIDQGYLSEMDYVRDIPALKHQTPTNFLNEYIYVVLNAGMKQQVAQKIYKKFMTNKDLSKIGHTGKRAAIDSGLKNHRKWFAELQASEDPIQYLETLPWIGPITKYHLARNIGIDTVKPDRHLVRLSQKFGFSSPIELCKHIQTAVPEPLGVIDVVLWRYCNLHPGEIGVYLI